VGNFPVRGSAVAHAQRGSDGADAARTIRNGQDAVDYAKFLIRTTIDALRFEPRFPSVGGPIDLLVITPHRMQFVECKLLYDQPDIEDA